ncbi:MAG: hypothetical protein IPI67_33635 [Myxococcales bacterium]|nr:hypothetical protein [Myxococcales bacterium]
MSPKILRLSLLAIPALVAAVAHCAASDANESSSDGKGGADSGVCIGAACGGSGGSGGGSLGGAAGSGPPPEQELESSFRSPVATGNYVWAANPESGRVALINATTLEVVTVEAGNGPTHLAALTDPNQPDAARAIVLNVKSHDATVLVADAQGKVTTSTAEVHEDANAWAVSSKGRYAIAWTDAVQIPNADPTQGFQDVTVLDLAGKEPKSTRLSVGYRPTRVFIAANEKRAFVITEPGISVIELDEGLGPYVSKDLPVTDNPLDNPASRDVSVTPDGAYALVRRDGSSEVSIVALADGKRVSVLLSGPVTDLDLTDDGKRAIAIVREPGGAAVGDAGTGDAGADATDDDAASDAAADDGSDTGLAEAGVDDAASDAGTIPDAPPPPPKNSDVALLPIPGIFTKPAEFDQVTITGESVGSVVVSASGGVALLYTNATPNDHLTLLTTAAGSGYLKHRTVALKAPVKAVFSATDGSHAIALLSPTAGSSKAGAFSVIPVSAELPPKIQGTDAPPVGVAMLSATTSRALVTVRDDTKKIFFTYLVRMPELQVDPFKLASPPLATGIVKSANAGYIAQEHPEGRITFVTLADGKARTLTGFELGAKVVDGSK